MKNKIGISKWDGVESPLVPLGNGLFATVDDEDWERCKEFTWNLSNTNYARTTIRKRTIDGKRVSDSMYLHNFIYGDRPDGLRVDHINMNKLDCRKSNLRLATRAQNKVNCKVYPNSKSGFKGVFPLNGKWEAFANRKRLGAFPDPVSAARAYDDEARVVFGEYARLNFPRQGEESAR